MLIVYLYVPVVFYILYFIFLKGYDTAISKIICGHWLVQNTSGSRNFALTSLPNFNNN
jgi:hypothetical protein